MTSPLWEGVREGCGSCEFGYQTAPTSQVLCRRHPPTLLVMKHYGSQQTEVQQHQPWMAIDDWCGEYRRRGG